jgi:hypothetical protein
LAGGIGPSPETGPDGLDRSNGGAFRTRDWFENVKWAI